MKNLKTFSVKFYANILFATILSLMIATAGQNTFAQQPLTFKDAQGSTITFPYGELSFADRVVSTEKGTTPATNPDAIDPKGVLGLPDYENSEIKTYLSLGTNGSVTVEFTDNYLVDIPGPDLWIFEIGPAVESTKIAISKDGRNWIDIGIIKGSTSGIDISPFVKRGDRFSFVKITDNNNGSGEYAGADIDAIGAIGSIKREPEQPTGGINPPTKSNSSRSGDCCNFLRVEMKDGSVQMIDLSNVLFITPTCND